MLTTLARLLGRVDHRPPFRHGLFRSVVSARPLLWALLALLGAGIAHAQTATPPELRDWESWVLHGHETHQCPWLVPGLATDEERVCAWPGVLELQVEAHGGRFSEHWQVGAESWVPLPGNAEAWPQSVTLDGHPAAVVLHQGLPMLRMAGGPHTMAGSLAWSHRAELLALPQSIGLVALTVDGARVPSPQRSDAGITLGAQSLARQDNRLELHVFRCLDDLLPARLTTQLRLAVAGEAREIRLPQALPQGFVPISVEGPLAARLDPDNTLRVQIRPGQFELRIEARGPSPLSQVSLGARAAPWPAEEVWSFRPQDRLRVVSIEGAPLTDPLQANVPQEWAELPAYRMSAEATLRVSERSRGISAQDANQLQLRRTAWLDFTGRAYTVLDNINGSMHQGWRLDMSPPYQLQSAHLSSGTPVLVTAGAAAGVAGLEVRAPGVELTALSRLPRTRAALPATGWQQRFTHVSGELVLGPGFRLLAALGPDTAPEAWLERWRLLDIFVVLLIGTVAWRMFGVRTTLIALGALGLTYQESGAVSWLWLNLLIALALLRSVPAGRLQRWARVYRALALIALVIAVVPFLLTQVRLAVYPQLEALASGRSLEQPPTLETVPPLATVVENKAVAAPSASAGMFKRSTQSAAEVVVTAEKRAAVSYEPGVLVQAGPGVPNWYYHVYHYAWSGPLEAQATTRFIISPPWLTRLWRLLGVALSVLLLYELSKLELPRLSGWLPRGRAAPLVILLASAALLPAVRAQAAATPDAQLLKELETRLLAPPKCAPDCAAIVAAEVHAGERLTVLLQVSALDGVGLALPGAEPNWAPDTVQLDGAAAGWVYRNAAGTRYVQLAPGHHTVRLEGPLHGLEALALAFPLVPHRIDVSAAGWDIGGLNERRLVSGALQLTRRRVTSEPGSEGTRQEEFPAFVEVTRAFDLAREWTIETTLTRVAPTSRAFSVRLSLLPQEAVTSPGLQATDHAVTVGLEAGEDDASFSSVLPRTDTLELIAAAHPAYSEHWSFAVDRNWHVDFTGVPAVLPQEEGDGWLFEYYPRPGEQLRLQITRPAAIAGGTLAFDSVQLHSAIGKRSSDTTLLLHYRSTQGGRHVLHLPPEAAVTSVLSDGEAVALRPERDELPLSALPGAHSWSIQWQTPAGVRLITRSPAVGLAAPTSNLRFVLQLPEDRWLLYVFGPGVGPTVLYWGELLCFALIAWLIGRSGLTQLATRDWLLLGLGLSTFSWSIFALFVVFVALFEWRARSAAPTERSRFNLLQLALGALGVIAIVAVVAAVPQGLLARPDMHIAAQSEGELSWLIDQTAGQLPQVGVLSVSLWWYKLAMLTWALWLSFALTGWIRWAWGVFTRDGLWRSRAPRPPASPAAPGAA